MNRLLLNPTRPRPQTSTRPWLQHLRGRGGFTLSEVLIAMGILAVGITAVASLFPAAILLQKENVRDILGQQNVRSIDAMLRGKSLDGETLYLFTEGITSPTAARSGPADVTPSNITPAAIARGVWPNNNAPDAFIVPNPEFDIYALSEIDVFIPDDSSTTVFPPGSPFINTTFPDMRPATNYGGFGSAGSYSTVQSYLGDWGLLDRSFPSYVPDFRNRELYTVPLVRRGLQASDFVNDWVVYAMVLERRPADTDAYLPTGDANQPYPSAYPNGLAGLGARAANAIVCANPFDDPDTVPKVFRVPALKVDGNENRITLGIENDADDGSSTDRWGLLIRPGDLLLGDDGNIYRVSSLPDPDDLNLLEVAKENRQQFDIDEEKDLRAVWFAVRPAADAPSPLRDIRVLSQDVVRLLN